MTNQIKVLEAVLACRPNVRQMTEMGNLALHEAVKSKNEHMVELLLHYRALPNQLDGEGNSALHVATEMQEPKMAMILLLSGADPNLKNKEGCSSILLADCYRNKVLLEMFRKFDYSQDDMHIKYTVGSVMADLALYQRDLSLKQGAVKKLLNAHLSNQRDMRLAALPNLTRQASKLTFQT